MADEEGDPAGRENGVYGSATSRKGDENSLDRLTGGDEQRTKSRGTCQAHPELWGSGRKTDKDPWPLAHPNPPPPSLSKNGLVSVCVCVCTHADTSAQSLHTSLQTWATPKAHDQGLGCMTVTPSSWEEMT